MTVYRGVVTLTGRVDSFAKRVAAQRAAHRVAGVLDVANDIEVKLSDAARPWTDTDLARAVRRTLESSTLLRGDRISSTVSEGQVSLEGEVESLAQSDDVEAAVAQLPGIRLVVNNLVVNPPKTVAASEIRRAIHDALERRIARESQRLRVDAVDGIVTLSGSVHTWAEKKAAVGAARGTAGVRSVQDQLRIEP